MPITKAPPPKKFSPSNTDTKTGKPKAPTKVYPPSSPGPKNPVTFHPTHAPTEQKAPTPVTKPTSNSIRENITALERRSKEAGI